MQKGAGKEVGRTNILIAVPLVRLVYAVVK
jgi:hypothetical protein